MRRGRADLRHRCVRIEIIGGSGRYLGATGRAVKNKEVPGGSDLVVKVRLR